MEELAKQRQITLEEAREQYADNLDDIKNTIQIRKTIDFLMDNAVFVERMEPETEDGEPGEDKQQPEDENQDKEAQAEEQKAADNEPEA